MKPRKRAMMSSRPDLWGNTGTWPTYDASNSLSPIPMLLCNSLVPFYDSLWAAPGPYVDANRLIIGLIEAP